MESRSHGRRLAELTKHDSLLVPQRFFSSLVFATVALISSTDPLGRRFTPQALDVEAVCTWGAPSQVVTSINRDLQKLQRMPAAEFWQHGEW